MFGSQQQLNRHCGYPNNSQAYQQCKTMFCGMNLLNSMASDQFGWGA